MSRTLADVAALISARTGHSTDAMTRYAVETAEWAGVGVDLSGASVVSDEQADELLTVAADPRNAHFLALHESAGRDA